MMNHERLLLSAVLCLGACSDEPGAEQTETVCTEDAPSLQWKRTHAFSRDLMQALELAEDEVCAELDGLACTTVHRIALGSSDPFVSQVYRRPERPSTLTPIVMDRFVLSACSKRATLDAASQSPIVFSALDLRSSVSPTREEAVDQVGLLYQRLLGRDATDAELAVLEELSSTDGMTGLDFAKLSCFAIAGTTEFSFI